MHNRLPLAALVIAAACTTSQSTSSTTPVYSSFRLESRHLTNIRQLTYGGDNAEAYFSRDGKRLIFQSTRDGRTCDQQFVMNVDGTGVRRVSTGDGQDDVRLLLRRRPQDLLRLDARRRHRLPAPPRSVEGLRVGTRPVRHLHRERRRLGPQAAHQLRRLHDRRRRCRPTARRSCSRRSRTAISTSTR